MILKKWKRLSTILSIVNIKCAFHRAREFQLTKLGGEFDLFRAGTIRQLKHRERDRINKGTINLTNALK